MAPRCWERAPSTTSKAVLVSCRLQCLVCPKADIDRRPPRCYPGDCRHSRNGSYGMSVRIAGSLRLDAGRLDHLGPFLGFVGNELAKIGGRARERRAA